LRLGGSFTFPVTAYPLHTQRREVWECDGGRKGSQNERKRMSSMMMKVEW
jgi:hypothetical protein